MLFRDIIGQDELKAQLVDNIDSERIAHAQLFIGESGYGALALAIAYAQYLNCSNKKEGDSCGECPSCFKFQNLQHPDLHFIYPINKSPHSVGSNSDGDVVSINLLHMWCQMMEQSQPRGYFTEQEWYKTIELSKNSQGIIAKGEANSLINNLGYKSVEGGYKVVIIWLAEQMNDASANALLKLFEEPSEKTLFLFITHKSSAIIKTILSRTQHTYIKPVDEASIRDYLINQGVDIARAEIASHLASGDVITAVNIASKLESGEVDDNFDHFVALMRLCFAVNHLGLMEWAENIAALNKEQLKRFLTYSVSLLRAAYMKNIGMTQVIYSYPYELEFLAKFAPFVHYQNIEELIAQFERCSQELQQNANQKIVVTHFTLAISKMIKRVGKS